MSAAVWPRRSATATEPGTDPGSTAAAAKRRGVAVRTLVGLAIAALLLLWKPWLAAVVAVISLLVLALALASPLGLYARFEHGLERVAHGVGMGVTWILMPVLYLLLFLPVGLLLRAAGKLRLTRHPDPGATTYWHAPQRGGEGTGDRDENGDGDRTRWQGSGLDRYRRQF